MIDAKAYLQQIKLYDTHITNKLSEMSRLKELVTSITATWKDDVVSGSGSKDKLGDTVAKIVDLENEVNKAIDNLIDRKNQIGAILEQLNDPDHVAVLHKRYVLYMTWEEIAYDMHMTYRNVCYIHGRALQAVEEIIKKQQNFS